MTPTDLQALRAAAIDFAKDPVHRMASDRDVWAEFLEALACPMPWSFTDLAAVEETSQEVLSQKSVQVASDEAKAARLVCALAHVMGRDAAELNSELAGFAEVRWSRAVGGAP